MSNSWRQLSRPGAVSFKSDRDAVSELDVMVERAVREVLQRGAPGVSFLGEEEGVSGNSDSELMWVLDPIDGTMNLLHGLPLCAISLVVIGDYAVGL